MASVGASACRRLKLAEPRYPAKPRQVPVKPSASTNLRFKLLEGEAKPMGAPTKSRVVKKEGNLIFVSFSNENPKPKKPSLAQKNQKTKQEIFQKPIHPTGQKEKPCPSSSFAPSAIRQEGPTEKISVSGIRLRGSARSSSSSQKGLQNLRRGKFDQTWMIKWLDWYKFVIAMTRKTWDTSSPTHPKTLSTVVRAESAKTAWAS